MLTLICWVGVLAVNDKVFKGFSQMLSLVVHDGVLSSVLAVNHAVFRLSSQFPSFRNDFLDSLTVTNHDMVFQWFPGIGQFLWLHHSPIVLPQINPIGKPMLHPFNFLFRLFFLIR